MLLSASGFVEMAKALNLRFPTFWVWHESKKFGECGYLTSEKQIMKPKPMAKVETLEESVQEEDAYQLPTEFSSPVVVEYHVVYSSTYHVPMLFFDAQYLDGSPLTHEEVMTQMISERPEDVWTFLTQQYHPELGTPCFGLHPCKTATMMAEIFGSLESFKGKSEVALSPPHYLLAFISLIGPIAGLHVPLKHHLDV